MYRALRADEIELRVGSVGKKKDGFTLLCYKDARCDQNILDEVYGEEYWQRDHKEIKGNLYGGVGIYNKALNQWIWKWDCGTESHAESQKGEASDSFKRACFNLGIGRELYTAPLIWVDGHMKEGRPDAKFVYGLRVSLVEYDESSGRRSISKMQIKDKEGNVVFSHGIRNAKTDKPEKPGRTEKTGSKKGIGKTEMANIVAGLCDQKRYYVPDLCRRAGVDSLEDMTEEQLSKWVDWLEKQ